MLRGNQPLQHTRSLVVVTLLFGLFTPQVFGLTLALPPPDNNIVGEIKNHTLKKGETLHSLARRYDVGYQALLNANPSLKTAKEQAGMTVIIPTAFILPNAPRDGIVVNTAELRLYFYLPTENIVMTYPIGIGRDGFETPLSQTYVTTKEINPTWVVPESVRSYVRDTRGEELPDVVLPGPDNPLGDYAIHMDLAGYLIHGTNQPQSVGQRSSSGCIRMYPEDIAQLFSYVNTGTPVYIIHAPVKLGWFGSDIYLEAHEPLPQYAVVPINEVLSPALASRTTLDWKKINQLLEFDAGYPIFIGRRL